MSLFPASLRVLFLGPLRDRLGCEAAEIPFAGLMTQAQFLEALCERFPAVKPIQKSLRLARGNEYLDATATLQPGDEIALIPPVSGG